MKQVQLVSVDWLELYCQSKREGVFTGEDVMQVGGYELKLKGNGTRFFEYIYEVREAKQLLATLVAVPRAKFLNSRMVLVKLENRRLYEQGWAQLACELVQGLGLVYKGITRLDLCCDLKRFYNDMRPHAFIKKYITSKSDDFDYMTRKGSNEFSVHGSKGAGGMSRINYIAWGSRTSQVRSYIYNKSKELREADHSKPWITDFWRQNGLEPDSKNDVWRCEISIRSQGMNVLNFETGELFKLRPEYMESQRAVERLFRIYAEKYFHFLVRNGKKKQRNFDRVRLFEDSGSLPCRPVSNKRFVDTGRTERVVAKNIERRLTETDDLTPMEVNSMQVVWAYYVAIATAKKAEYDYRLYKNYRDYARGKEVRSADALQTLSLPLVP